MAVPSQAAIAAMSRHFQIGIEDLPESSTRLLPGSVYAIAIHDDRYRLSLLRGTVLSAAAQRRAVWYVADGAPEEALSGTDAASMQLRHAAATGVLRAFRSPAAAAPDMSGRLIDELEHLMIPAGALLVIDGAERYLDIAAALPDDAAPLRRWRDWAERYAVAVVMLFRQRTEHAPDHAAALLPAARLLGGLARLRTIDGGAFWEVFHWFGANGVSAGQSRQLALRADGGLGALETAAARTAYRPAADEATVLALKSVLTRGQAVAAWCVLDDAETLSERAQDAVAATVLLSYDRTTSLDQLAHLVYTLRRTRGERLKIVVRESNVRLRYNQETMLLRLGVNLVVPAEVNHSRFLSLIGMVQGQVFARVPPASYEAAVADAMPAQEQGYLPPRRFAEAASAALDRSRSIGVQHALVRLPLAYGLTPFDALRYCVVKRNGDLCSADEDSVYVFLFACRESDVDLALDRLFQLPVPELFRGDERVLSATTIGAALHSLATRATAESLPDLSAELGAAPLHRTPVAPAAQFVDSAAADRFQRTPAPAVRRPLKLRPAPALAAIPASLP